MNKLSSSDWSYIPFIFHRRYHWLSHNSNWSLIPSWMKPKCLISYYSRPDCVFFDFPILQDTVTLWRSLISIMMILIRVLYVFNKFNTKCFLSIVSKRFLPAPIIFKRPHSFPTLPKKSTFCITRIFNCKISGQISSTLILAFTIIFCCCFRICFWARWCSKTRVSVLIWTKRSRWCSWWAC